MALASTIYNVPVELNDVDRGVYQSLALRLAKHPSETVEYMASRLLAYCLEYTEGIEMTAGLSDGDEPAIVARDLTGKSHAGSKSASRTPIGCIARASWRNASPSIRIATSASSSVQLEGGGFIALEKSGSTHSRGPSSKTSRPDSKDA